MVMIEMCECEDLKAEYKCKNCNLFYCEDCAEEHFDECNDSDWTDGFEKVDL